MDRAAIANRVRAAIDESLGRSQSDRSIASQVGMTPDAFSRAVNGERSFSSIELARLADLLRADIHFLITGEPDPYRVAFVARHDYDPLTGQRHVPGAADDAGTLEAIKLAYSQAQMWRESGRQATTGSLPMPPNSGPAVELPRDPASVRTLLGPDFVRSFAERTEEVFGIDVLRLQNLSTDYSFTLGAQRVVMLRAQGNWFRANSSLAHELGHLALGHHDVNSGMSAAEAAANHFGSELLLPADQMRAINWLAIDEEQLARKVWDWGISGQMLAVRLAALKLPCSAVVQAALQQPTQRLLRHHMDVLPEPQAFAITAGTVTFASINDPITARMKTAAERRIPDRLIRSHLDGIAAGFLSKATLAWLLETAEEELSVDEPTPPPDVEIGELAANLGLTSG